MSATTPHYQLPYPESSDQIRLIPDQLKALATKTDTAIYGAAPRSGSTLAGIDTIGTTIGQQAYVYKAGETEMAQAGPYWWYAGEWIRPAQPAAIFQMPPNDDWALEGWQWQTFGQPYLYIRVRAKHDITIERTSNEWGLGTFTQSAYIPPMAAYFPAFANTASGAIFGFTISGRGLVMVTRSTNVTIKANDVIFAMLTWPCPNVGRIRSYTQP